MLWLKAFHIIFLVTWFSGLFYLPRLYVYHAMSKDAISIERFKIMEKKLLFWITTPGGILATLFGFALLFKHWTFYSKQPWMHAKLGLIVILWAFHFVCFKYYFDFKNDKNPHSQRFYRWFNEIPTFLLISIVILAVVKPSF